jgi:hypothetical protein
MVLREWEGISGVRRQAGSMLSARDLEIPQE